MAHPRATAVFVFLLGILATTLVVMVIAPFAGPLFAASVIAGVLYPAQRWTAGRLGGRDAIAAGAVTLAAVLVVIAPLSVLGMQGGEQLAVGFQAVQQAIDEEGLDGAIQRLPAPLQAPAASLAERLPHSLVGDSTGSTGKPDGSRSLDIAAIAGWVGRAIRLALDLVIDIGVLILALYFMLAQGRRLVDWVSAVMPLGEGDSEVLIGTLRDVNRGVFVATIGSAFVQTLIAGVGYWIAGTPWIPASLLLTFIAALIPVIGGAVIVVGVGAFVWMQGDTGYGIFLVCWGVGFVGLADNFVKPLLATRKTKLPSSIIFFAMLGGLSVFGPMGVIAGPLVVSFFITMLRLMREQGWVHQGLETA